MGEEERAEQQAEIVNRVSKGFFVVPYAAMKYRRGSKERAFEILCGGKDDSMLAELVYVEAMAVESPQDAAKWYDTIKHLRPLSASPGNQWMIPESVLLAGRDLERARERCRERFRTADGVAPWGRAHLEFVFAENSEEAMVQFFAAVNPASAKSQTQLMNAYRLVGMKYLAEGNTDKAIEYLRKARLETAAFFWPLAYWAEALARELERKRLASSDRSDETHAP